MEQIIAYIKHTYHPLTVILYGSYANGTNDADSDFDALVIARDCEQAHDTSFVDNIPLDVFIYPLSYFDETVDYDEFIQIFDGKLLMDTDGYGAQLLACVRSYLYSRPHKTKAENQANLDWCVKMLERARRNDAEGMFRWHWVLNESLEIFCDIARYPYFGPKKTLQWMKTEHPEAFACYEKALFDFQIASLENWISYIKSMHF